MNIVGIGWDKRKERASGLVIEAVVKNVLKEMLPGAFLWKYQTSVVLRVAEGWGGGTGSIEMSGA